MHKSRDECVMDFSEDEKPSLKEIVKVTCKKFGCKEKAGCSIIYNKSGIKLFDEDANFIKVDDVLYIALDGKHKFLSLHSLACCRFRLARLHSILSSPLK